MNAMINQELDYLNKKKFKIIQIKGWAPFKNKWQEFLKIYCWHFSLIDQP